MKNLLITGGAGFIGSHFVEHALKSNDHDFAQICILDLLTYSGLSSNVDIFKENSRVKFIRGDIADRNLVRSVILENQIDSIVNFAAESHVDRSILSSMPFIHSNVLGLTNLLESFRELCAGRFLQISTDEVYGSIPEGSWDETEPLSPNSPYSASKAGADLISLAFQKTYNLNLCITRCSNNYGPRQFPEKLIPLFITNLIDGKKLPLYGSGENVRDWIYVSDHCLAIEKVLTLGLEGEVYNVGGHYEISNLELTVEILRHFQGDKSLISYVPDRLGHDFRYSVDDKKIRKNLDFENYVSFEEGLTKTVEWYKNHPAWWRKLK